MVSYQITETAKKRNVPASEKILIEMRGDILRGTLRPGHKIVEQDICRNYGASRTPVREALKQLEKEGLVETVLNKGARVIGLSEQDFEDVMDMRASCEIQAVRWAIERITEEEREELEENFEFMEFYTFRKDTMKMLTINEGFHQIIYEAAHNRMLRSQLETFQNLQKHRRFEICRKDNCLESVLEEHRAIFRAFIDDDVKAGELAMEIHMNRARERYCG